MKQDRVSRTATGWKWAAATLGVCGVFATGTCCIVLLAPGGTLHAAQTESADFDSDGLRDAQEAVLGSSTLHADSDQDGFSDLEEFARDTSPIDDEHVPTATRLSVAISARGEQGRLQVYMAVFEPRSVVGRVDVRVGMLNGGHLMALSAQYMDTHAVTEQFTFKRGRITTYDLSVNPNVVLPNRNVSWFIAAVDRQDDRQKAAAVADVFRIDGVLVLRVPHDLPPGAAFAQPGGGGSLYRPIPPDGLDSIPEGDWTPGLICMREAAVVGYDGAIVTQEVVSAECLEDWNAFCSTSCPSSAGAVFQTIDPVVLVGN